MISHEILNKLETKQTLTFEEIKYILDFIREEAKRKVGINESNQELYCKKPDEINISKYTKCFESCMSIGNLCDSFNIGFQMINTNGLQIPDLKHYFAIISFREKNLSFIMDITYIQFLKNRYPVIIDGKSLEVIAPGIFFSRKNKNDLMWDGYITCTELNFKDYISSFIKSNKTKRELDENFIINYAISQLPEDFSFTTISDFSDLVEKEQLKNKVNS